MKKKIFLKKLLILVETIFPEFMRNNALQTAEALVDFEIYKKLIKKHEKNNHNHPVEGWL